MLEIIFANTSLNGGQIYIHFKIYLTEIRHSSLKLQGISLKKGQAENTELSETSEMSETSEKISEMLEMSEKISEKISEMSEKISE